MNATVTNFGAIVAAILIISGEPLQSAEVVTLVTPERPEGDNTEKVSVESIVLEAGDFCETLYGSNGAWLDVTIGSARLSLHAYNASEIDRRLPAIAGPAVIRASNQSPTTKWVMASFRVIRKDEIRQPAGGIMTVIPADASGAFNVALESSVDAVSWAPVTPGVYSAEEVSRFFRVRMEKLPD